MTDLGAHDYVWLGIQAVFAGPEAFALFGLPISITVAMVTCGMITGILVGATPGLGGDRINPCSHNRIPHRKEVPRPPKRAR